MNIYKCGNLGLKAHLPAKTEAYRVFLSALTMADLPDDQNRLLTTTQTRNGYWDQIVPMSQTMINRGFDSLYKVHPKLATMYDTQKGVGTIDAKLAAPTVLIPVGDGGVASNRVFFQLRYLFSLQRMGEGSVTHSAYPGSNPARSRMRTEIWPFPISAGSGLQHSVILAREKCGSSI